MRLWPSVRKVSQNPQPVMAEAKPALDVRNQNEIIGTQSGLFGRITKVFAE